jgi:hypothetical protein
MECNPANDGREKEEGIKSRRNCRIPCGRHPKRHDFSSRSGLHLFQRLRCKGIGVLLVCPVLGSPSMNTFPQTGVRTAGRLWLYSWALDVLPACLRKGPTPLNVACLRHKASAGISPPKTCPGADCPVKAACLWPGASDSGSASGSGLCSSNRAGGVGCGPQARTLR